MNIIEKMREIIGSFPRIAEVCGEVHIDFTDPEPENYGLSSVGDSLLREDVTGNQLRQHNFILYAIYSGINDYERISSSGVLLELSLWLPEQCGTKVETTIGGEKYAGTITNITAGNGQLLQINEDNIADGFMYQLTVTTQYTVEF